MERNILFGTDNLPFDTLVIVRSSTCRAQAVHVVLDIVVAELAYLGKLNRSVQRPQSEASFVQRGGDGGRSEGSSTYLVAAWAWPEIFV